MLLHNIRKPVGVTKKVQFYAQKVRPPLAKKSENDFSELTKLINTGTTEICVGQNQSRSTSSCSINIFGIFVIIEIFVETLLQRFLIFMSYYAFKDIKKKNNNSSNTKNKLTMTENGFYWSLFVHSLERDILLPGTQLASRCTNNQPILSTGFFQFDREIANHISCKAYHFLKVSITKQHFFPPTNKLDSKNALTEVAIELAVPSHQLLANLTHQVYSKEYVIFQTPGMQALTLHLEHSHLIRDESYVKSCDPTSFLKICHQNDTFLNDCIMESVVSLKPYLKSGIPGLGIPACEPFRLEEIEIDQTSGPIHIRAIYNNVSIYGGTNFVPKSIRFDLEENIIHVNLYFPRLEMIANYIMDGRILMLPITGNGVAHGNFTDIDVIMALQLTRYWDQRTGLIHQRVEYIYVDFDIGYATVYLDNLFDGDETLSAAMNLFLNDNWNTVIAEIKPKLEETIATLIMDFTNVIFSMFPEDVLLPP
ncbi:Protein takeout [Melipona quadrifasciata]|uniref:Protein takeout n=1 Tax=Melipona quadrifasciata TaxID=166423 RepID=A0A0M9A3V9_9HYME|nr:Protein takeout [Melipona quadrifasciata]